MQLLSRLLAVLVVCLIAIILPSSPAQAQCEGPFIELSVKSGVPGTDVIVYVTDCTAGKIVDIYYDGDLVDTGRTSSNGALTVMITIPEGSSGHHQVLADAGYTKIDTYFTVKPGLTLSPDNGPPGTTVTVEGQGFASNEGGIEFLYYLNDSYETIETDIAANSKGSWETSFRVPASERGQHKLDAQGAVSHLFEVEDAIFTVTAGISLDKSWGIMGDSITMTGSRFTAYEKGITILFGGQEMVTDIRADSGGEWQAGFLVPEMPAGEYTVTAEGDETRKEDVGGLGFEVKPQMALSTDEGHVGMNLTVTGHGFAGRENVAVAYDGSPVATVESSDQGSFEATFVVPGSTHGEHLVVGADSAGNAFTAVFTMESNHPDTPALTSPSRNARIGLFGEATPTLRWSEVADDSGVRYNLQVAASADVTATGAFADSIIAVPDLVETSYTISESQALPNGVYYWIVQAVDGAENESDWTSVRSFRVGLLPMWGFALIIVVIVVLISAAIRALVRKRDIYYDRW